MNGLIKIEPTSGFLDSTSLIKKAEPALPYSPEYLERNNNGMVQTTTATPAKNSTSNSNKFDIKPAHILLMIGLIALLYFTIKKD